MKHLILLAFLTTMFFSSCKQVENEPNDYPADQIIQPSIEEIKNDLLDNEVGIWKFSKLEEFKSVKIVATSIVDSLNLKIDLDLDLVDYETGTQCKGKLEMFYSRKDISINKWKFKDVTGDVYINDESEKTDTNESGNDETETNTSKTEYEQNSNNESSSNNEPNSDKERILTCKYCGEKFTQKLVIISSYLGDIEVWDGGANHCDPNWSSKKDKNMADMYEMREAIGDGRKKYCSRKCACDAGED